MSESEPLPTPYADWLASTFERVEAQLAEAEPVRSAHDGAPDDVAGRLEESVERRADDLVELSRSIHANPELVFAEHHATKAISELLTAHGHDCEVGVGGLDTAVRAEVGSGGRPRVAVCAEYDALPGIGHACGHNVIAATATGALLATADVAGDLDGSVTLIGCPAEEGGGGKEYLAQAGVFDDVDAAIMVHPFGADVAAHEWLGVRTVDVVYEGLSAHAAATPFLGRNALDAVVAAYNGIAQLRQHVLPGDRLHGVITDGGQKPNVVPERAAASFFLRSRSLEGIDELTERARVIFEAAAQSTGTRAHLIWDTTPLYLPVRNNHALAARYAEALAPRGRTVAPEGIWPAELTGSTDMGNISLRVPAIHPLLGIAPPTVPIHNPEFAKWAASERGDAGVVDGAIGLARTAADFLCDERLRRDVREEFDAAGGVVDVASMMNLG